MAKEAWLISDTHFGHKNIITFEGSDGKLIRPFGSTEEMDELMVERWNKVVGPFDRVYHLGDVVINRRCLPILSRLNGKKVLIKGNHDIFSLKDYTPYFEDIRACKVYPAHGIICTHIPVYNGQLTARFGTNVHGHMHTSQIRDDRYINVCVENIDYTPVNLNEIIERVKERQ